MKARTPLLAAVVAAILALTACANPGPAGGHPPARQEQPERGSDHGGGGMM
jgi:hypothetical protein